MHNACKSSSPLCNGTKTTFNRQRVEKRITEATVGHGVLIFDDTGFDKKGTASVGVAHQYSGTLGKVGNCQAAVTCCYADARASWPVAVRLYLPQERTDDPERLKRARGPANVTFQTKAQIALELLDQARAWGVPHRGVTSDADYGDNLNFLAGLEARHERYVVAVRCDFQVRVKARGAPPCQRADQVLAAVPRCQWRTIRWRHGTKGWLRKKFERCFKPVDLVCVMREIRMLHTMWRELETESRDGLRHRLMAKAAGNSYSPCLKPPRLLSTLPGCRETGIPTAIH